MFLTTCHFAFILLCGVLFFTFATPVDGAEWSKLKTCADLGFCRRQRHFFLNETLAYAIVEDSLKIDKWKGMPALVARLGSSALDSDPLQLVVTHIGSGVFRTIVTEFAPLHERNIVEDALARGVGALPLDDATLYLDKKNADFHIRSAPSKVRVWFEPFKLEFIRAVDDKVVAVINSQSRLFVEALRKKPTPEPTPSVPTESKESESPTAGATDSGSSSDLNVERQEAADEKHADYDLDEEYEYEDADREYEDAGTEGIGDDTEKVKQSSHTVTSEEDCAGCWEEKFQSHTDPKSRGPESVGTDIVFPSAEHIYGIPERTVRFSLGDTVDAEGNVLSEPYRLYNLDVFEFELDKPLGLYGSIPFLMARKGKDSVGMLWLNSAETYVDVRASKERLGKSTHWYSETGIIDVYLMPGPTAGDVFKQYLRLTGAPAMPQRFSLGYHQCRWNYRDEEDSKAVDAGFDERDIPYDVLWLDIEHTDGKRYFTWDYSRFPDPTGLQNHIAARGRKMVTIIDPHVKRDNKYALHRFATEQKYYVMNGEGTKPFDGWCWPGSSSYFDFTSPEIRAAWASRFNPKDYPHFTEHLHTWIDMNEPSVFNGPEGTMQKNLLHAGNTEHRHVHNIYGHYYMQATFEGLLQGHGGNDRPFVLSRSFFAGSQRYGAIWTGDNTASWDHLESTVRMLLPLQISGMVFAGADVGGFFGNPAPELLTRWYQVGAFQPFFRGHAHLDTNRREPWLFGEPYTEIIAKAIRTRYEYLPFWYTLFAGNALGDKVGLNESRDGPPMRPLWWEFADGKVDENQRQWMVGKALLVAPVLEENVNEHTVHVPEGELWYDIFHPEGSGMLVKESGSVKMKSDLSRMFVFQRGGTIVPKLERRRRSTAAMATDPLTLVVALDNKGEAEGEIYLDDGKSYDHERGHYVVRRFAFGEGVLSVQTVGGGGKEFTGNDATVERVVLWGWNKKVQKVEVDEREVGFNHVTKHEVLTIQRPNVKVAKGDWRIKVV